MSSDPDERSIARLLDNPAVWAEVPPGLKDRVLAEALGRAPGGDAGGAGDGGFGADAGSPGRDDGDNVVTPLQGRPRHAVRGTRPLRPPLWQRPVLLAAAAVALIGISIGGTLVATQDETPSGGTEVALAGTENMPDASATVQLLDEPSGVSVTLNVSGLPPAPERTFYEAWLVSEELGKVSAGTFHIREPQEDITLWLGVDPANYDAITVTRQPIEGGTLADGVVVLRGDLP